MKPKADPQNDLPVPSTGFPGKPVLILEKFFRQFSFGQGLLAIFFIACLSRLAAILVLANYSQVSGMENETIAQNLLAGKGYCFAYIINEMPSALVGPVYTVFLYLHFLIFGQNYFWVEMTQGLLGAFSALLLAWLGRCLAGERIGIISGLLFSLYPVYVYWCSLPLSLTVDVFLLLLGICLALWSTADKKLWKVFLAGAVMGLTALSKSFYLTFPALYLAWLWLYQKARFRELIYIGAVWATACVLVIMPWTIRNHNVFGQWVPLTTNGGANLWYGNNDQATGALYTKAGKPMLSAIPAELMEKLSRAKTEADKDRILYQAGREWIKQNPKKFLQLIPLRLRALWWFDPEMPSRFFLFRKVVYIFLAVFAVSGIWVARKNLCRDSIFYLLFLWHSLFYSCFVGQARFRYLFEFAFLFFAALSLNWLYQTIGRTPGKTPESGNPR